MLTQRNPPQLPRLHLRQTAENSTKKRRHHGSSMVLFTEVPCSDCPLSAQALLSDRLRALRACSDLLSELRASTQTERTSLRCVSKINYICVLWIARTVVHCSG